MSSLLSLAGNAAPTSFYDFPIDQSLRFEDGDSAYLSRTPASAGNRKTWTWSGWVKRGNLGSNMWLFEGSLNANNRTGLKFNGSDQLELQARDGGSNVGDFITNAVYRDTGTWYHICLVWNSLNTQSTLYVNGVEVTSYASKTNPSNINHYVNSTNSHGIGAYTVTSSQFFDGYMAEVNFIDGQALDASSFGETKSGIWIPKDTSGLTFGTNGFRLAFGDSAAIGDDTSGNTNDWTANNLVASDVVLDSPTNNFAVWSSIDTSTGTTLQEGNTEITFPSLYGATRSTFGVSSGKWYWEVRINNNASNHSIGILESSDPKSSYIGGSALGYGYVATNGSKYNNATLTAYGATYTTGDIISVALDMDAGTITFYKNGSTQGQAFSGISGTYHPAISDVSNNSSGSNSTVNFGQDSTFAGLETAGGNADENGYGDFAYAPPSGYLSLCSANLPSGAIDTLNDETPEDYFNAVLYTGNATTATSITSVGFQPSLTWIKNRTDIVDHVITDAVRGATIRLESNSTDAEITQTEDLQSFDADGFTVGNQNRVNGSGDAIVAWNWKAGGAGVSNTDGSITSTVSVGATSQQNWFSVVGYTGNATAGATVGHGLNTQPDMIITKARGAVSNWFVYHSANTSQPETDYLTLETTNATTDNSTVWNDTAPTSSVFSIGQSGWNNTSGVDYIAYCFANAEGLCKVGSYTGNGSTDGTFVYTGFRPAWVMWKRTDAVTTSNWFIVDNKRDTYNVVNSRVWANATNAESDADSLDFLSSGFKIRSSANLINASGGSYIYLAIAEQDFRFANAR